MQLLAPADDYLRVQPMPLSYDYGYGPSGYDFGPAVDYGPGYVPARGQGQG